MDYQSMQAEVTTELGVIGAGIIAKLPVTYIKDKLNDGQKEVAKIRLCVNGTTTVNTVIGTEQYPLDSKYIEGTVKRVTFDGNPLKLVDASYRDKYAPTYANGTPEKYYIQGRNIGILPRPNAVKSVVVEHKSLPVDMALNADVSTCPEITHHAIVLYAAFKCLDFMDESKAADKWNDYQQALDVAGNLVNKPASRINNSLYK